MSSSEVSQQEEALVDWIEGAIAQGGYSEVVRLPDRRSVTGRIPGGPTIALQVQASRDMVAVTSAFRLLPGLPTGSDDPVATAVQEANRIQWRCKFAMGPPGELLMCSFIPLSGSLTPADVISYLENFVESMALGFRDSGIKAFLQ